MWFSHTVEHYSAIKRNKTEPSAETWKDPETVRQNEVGQKEKNKGRILMHVCRSQKNGTNEPVCKAETETQTETTNVWTPKGKRGNAMNWEIGIDIYIYMTTYKIDN